MNNVEALRGEVVRHVKSGRTFGADWQGRRRRIGAYLGPPSGVTAARVVQLGDHLSELFQLRESDGSARDQAGVSGGGVVWDALVNMYLNMCYAGTSVVALTSPFVPTAVKTLCRVSFNNRRVDPGLDHVLIHLPTSEEPTADQNPVEAFAEQVQAKLGQATVVLLECKTNWNDNIQTPMLWNLLFQHRRSGSAIAELSFGIGQGPERLADLDIAFITVPTNRIDAFHSKSMPVSRGSTMSGGVYWGRPTKHGIAWGLSEFGPRQAAIRESFPRGEELGVAFARAVRTRSDDIDLDAFDLYTG